MFNAVRIEIELMGRRLQFVFNDLIMNVNENNYFGRKP